MNHTQALLGGRLIPSTTSTCLQGHPPRGPAAVPVVQSRQPLACSRRLERAGSSRGTLCSGWHAAAAGWAACDGGAGVRLCRWAFVRWVRMRAPPAVMLRFHCTLRRSQLLTWLLCLEVQHAHATCPSGCRCCMPRHCPLPLAAALATAATWAITFHHKLWTRHRELLLFLLAAIDFTAYAGPIGESSHQCAAPAVTCAMHHALSLPSCLLWRPPSVRGTCRDALSSPPCLPQPAAASHCSTSLPTTNGAALGSLSRCRMPTARCGRCATAAAPRQTVC